jgi:hypothetical protein
MGVAYSTKVRDGKHGQKKLKGNGHMGHIGVYEKIILK